MKNVTFPAGLAVVPGKDGDSLLVANNLSDEAVLVDAHGQVQTRSISPFGRAYHRRCRSAWS